MTERALHSGPGVSRERGVTLIELMVALLVIAVGIMALSGVQTRSSNDVYATGRQTRALSLAQEKIEETRAGGFAAAVADTGVSDGFNWITQVDSVNVGLRQITVTVSWDEGLASPRSITLDGLVSAR